MPRDTEMVRAGTTPDCIRAAYRGGRIVADRRRDEGWDADRIRREVPAAFARSLDEGDDYQLETLVAAVQRGIEAALAIPLSVS